MFSNKLFHFSYKSLNTASEKINVHVEFLFPMLLITEVLMTVFDFSRFLSRIHFLDGGFPSQWGGWGCFSDERPLFLRGGGQALWWWAIGFDNEGSKIIVGWA